MSNSKTINILNLQAASECTPDFCELNTPSFVDNECKRVNYYSSRHALVMKPSAGIKNIIDNTASLKARTIHNLKKIGVIFDVDKTTYHKVGYGHVTLKIEAVISRGFPDFPSERGLLFIRRKVKLEAMANSLTEKEAQLLMNLGGFKKSVILTVDEGAGSISSQVVELNIKTAIHVQEQLNEAVASQKIPERIHPQADVTAAKKGTEKCQSCPYSVYCMLPNTPPPICRNCIHFAIGDNGYAACSAQNNFLLNSEMQQNLHKCGMHVYKPDFLDSWAAVQGVEKKQDADSGQPVPVGYVYANKLTGEEFINSPEDDHYSSYEIHAAEGMDLIGSSNLNKIRKMFSAKLQENR